ncbi:MAG TPA: hypothetical protein QF753_00750 [Victivallales bacterium]|nr:hypothetical protein [Victivallales bacterium]
MKKIKIIFLSLLCFTLLTTTYAKMSEKHELPKTQIIIVGIVHQPTKNFKVNDVVNILKRVQPDVILLEYPISAYTTKPLPKLFKTFTGIETWNSFYGAMKYLQNHKDTAYRYFDISGRQKFYKENDFFALESNWNKILNEQYSMNNFNEEAKQALKKENIIFHAVNYFQQEYPRVINSTACYGISKLKRSIIVNTRISSIGNIKYISIAVSSSSSSLQAA